ncbi:MAG: leucine-rich repeat protein [Oscillospiraceae bacterium]|nr:leucine-rich repeat protein [Oscillospiraceae bacterium]
MSKRLTVILAAACTALLCQGIVTPQTNMTAITAKAAEEGSCGSSLTWSYDGGSTLTISGTGDMTDFANASETPWYDIRSSIEHVVFEEGVTSVGSNAFRFCVYLQDVSLPEGVTDIGDSAFYSCGLNQINFPSTLQEIGNYAFADTKITELTLPQGLTVIGDNAFYACSALQEAVIPESTDEIGPGAFFQCEALEKLTILNIDCWIGRGDETGTTLSTETLIGYPGSTAEKYAAMFGICFQSLYETVLEPGDINGDTIVNASDAAQVLIAAAIIGSGDDSGLTLAQTAAADFNGDGIVNASDATAILCFAANAGVGSAPGSKVGNAPSAIANLNVSKISVSCLKVTWDAAEGRTYNVRCESTDPNYAYANMIYYEKKSEGLCYVTGLRENSEYEITVEAADDSKISGKMTGRTEAVEVLNEYPYEDGWTNCFAYEPASGLKRDPAYSAILGCSVDVITGTGVMRDPYGDYCCAMGLFYGRCGDRFLVELENGTQFTTKICDSKGNGSDGEGRYHRFGGTGKCIIEFIYKDGCLPSYPANMGSYGGKNWSGLDLSDNIKSIKKISFGEPVEY